MKIEFSHGFIKIFKKRIASHPKIHQQCESRIRLFAQHPQDPQLRDHKLSGKLLGYRAFSITGDIRVVYYIENDVAYFVDIGTHAQVYTG